MGRGIQTQWDNILNLKLVGRYIVRHGITSIFVFHDKTNKIQLNDLLKNLNTSDNIQFQKKTTFTATQRALEMYSSSHSFYCSIILQKLLLSFYSKALGHSPILVEKWARKR